MMKSDLGGTAKMYPKVPKRISFLAGQYNEYGVIYQMCLCFSLSNVDNTVMLC